MYIPKSTIMYKKDLTSSQEQQTNTHNHRTHKNSTASHHLVRSTSNQSTARAIIRHIVVRGRHLEHTPVPNVIVIHVEELGRIAPRLVAILRRDPQTAIARHIVRDIQQRDIGHQQRVTQNTDVVVQVVVREVQPVLRIRLTEIRGPLLRTWKRAVRGVVGRLPHLGEFVEEPGYLRLVRVVVHEEDDAFSLQDHALEGRPVVSCHGDYGRDVRVLDQAGAFDVGCVGADERVGVVVEPAVSEQDGDNVEGMSCDPVVDVSEERGDGAGVEDIAGGVAEMRSWV